MNKKERERIFMLHNGICYLCGGKIDGTREAWDVEHIVAWELSRNDDDENLRPAHRKCHIPKTGDDIRTIRKGDRVRSKHIGTKAESRNKMRGGRNSNIKIKMDGTVVDRRTGKPISPGDRIDE